MSILLIISPVPPFSWLYYQDLGLLRAQEGAQAKTALKSSMFPV